ncbi:unnamed protein product [Ectocarpus fasciculatus]
MYRKVLLPPCAVPEYPRLAAAFILDTRFFTFTPGRGKTTPKAKTPSHRERELRGPSYETLDTPEALSHQGVVDLPLAMISLPSVYLYTHTCIDDAPLPRTLLLSTAGKNTTRTGPPSFTK